MATELETIHATHDQQKADLIRRHALEVEKFRTEIDELKNQNNSQDDDHLAQISALKSQLQILRENIPPPTTTQLDTSTLNLQQEQITELSDQLQSAQEQILNISEQNAELRQNLENAKEKINCLEETLLSKREELQEQVQVIEQYQETIQELRTELMQLQVDPDPTDCNRKGNSLFAEVIDQRAQVMHMLAAQNRSYNEMKRLYTQSQGQIRQLKEENALMVEEMGKIESVFVSAQTTHTNQLHQHIKELEKSIELANRKVQILEGQCKGKAALNFEFFR